MSDGASKLLGVLGHPIAHSQSPRLFKRILAAEGREDVVYRTFDLPNIEDFHTLTQDHPNLVGLNVTVPHKQAILSKLVGVSEEAQAVGAVNTLVKTPQGWEGHNTDVWGFQRSIQPFLANRHERALVLGTGGSAAAVHHILAKLGIEAVSVSRAGDSTQGTRALGRASIGYHEVSEWVVRHHLLVVHCTPVGMHPHDKRHGAVSHLVVDARAPRRGLDLHPCRDPFASRGARARCGRPEWRRHVAFAGREGLGDLEDFRSLSTTGRAYI